MAFDKTPTTWLSGVLQKDSDGSGNITGAAASKSYLLLEIGGSGDFPYLTTANADEATGDIRDIMYGVVSGFRASWESISDADHPNKMTVSASSTGSNSSSISRRFVFDFSNTVTTETVASE